MREVLGLDCYIKLAKHLVVVLLTTALCLSLSCRGEQRVHEDFTFGWILLGVVLGAILFILGALIRYLISGRSQQGKQSQQGLQPTTPIKRGEERKKQQDYGPTK